MTKPIPAREALSDQFEGVVMTADSAQLLAREAVEGAQVILSGTLILRYGLRFLGKPHISIIPGLLALDYGDMLVGAPAWEFITERSNRFPRAEVYGYRNDGKDDMTYVKNLDLALPAEALVYTDATATVPAARPVALIAPESADLPPRLMRCLPRYDSLAAWREARSA